LQSGVLIMPTFHFTKKRFVAALLCTLFLVTAAGWVFTGYLVELASQTVKKNLEDSNLIISLNVVNERKRIENAATAIAGSPLTLPVLEANTPDNIAKANNILDRYHKSLDAAACYIIAQDGKTLTSSNRNEKDSFVGQNYTFRPYFQEAIKGGTSGYFAVGTVSGKRGYFASAPVKNKKGSTVGVVAIKKELEDIEANLKQYIWFYVDDEGIIFMSSQPEALLKSLWPLDDKQKERIISSKQYGPGPFEPILQKKFTYGEEVTFRGEQYIVSQKAGARKGFSLILFWPTKQISMYRLFGVMLTLLANLLTLSFLAATYIFTQSNFKVKRLLEESQSQTAALTESECQLRDRKDELEGQKELLAQAEERSRLILGSIGEGIFGLDKEGRVTFLNTSASTILGYTEEEMIGREVHGLIHHSLEDGSDYPKEDCPIYATWTLGIQNHVTAEVLWRKDGRSFPVEYTSTPIMKDGKVMGAVLTFRDITERKQTETELKEHMDELESFTRLTIDREEKMIELKEEINNLLEKTGQEKKYTIVE
jgi:PAS domain S-box-containing protein